MVLVEYSDSDESSGGDSNDDDDDDDNKHRSAEPKEKSPIQSLKKRKREAPPPLPAAFHDLYASTVRSSNQDDPSLHGGRQRVTPHVQGNWPSHVYVEWYPDAVGAKKLKSLLDRIHDGGDDDPPVRVTSSLESDLGAELPLHVSLSRTLSLSGAQRQPFVDELQAAVGRSGVRPFDVVAEGLRWVANHENTRWFLALQLGRPAADGLNLLLRACGASAVAFGQPTLYVAAAAARPPSLAPPLPRRGNPRRGNQRRGSGMHVVSDRRASEDPVVDATAHFHVSIAWTLREPSPDMTARAAGITPSELHDIVIPVGSVKAKVGNVVTSIPLDIKKGDPHGILGL